MSLTILLHEDREPPQARFQRRMVQDGCFVFAQQLPTQHELVRGPAMTDLPTRGMLAQVTLSVFSAPTCLPAGILALWRCAGGCTFECLPLQSLTWPTSASHGTPGSRCGNLSSCSTLKDNTNDQILHLLHLLHLLHVLLILMILLKDATRQVGGIATLYLRVCCRNRSPCVNAGQETASSQMQSRLLKPGSGSRKQSWREPSRLQ